MWEWVAYQVKACKIIGIFCIVWQIYRIWCGAVDIACKLNSFSATVTVEITLCHIQFVILITCSLRTTPVSFFLVVLVQQVTTVIFKISHIIKILIRVTSIRNVISRWRDESPTCYGNVFTCIFRHILYKCCSDLSTSWNDKLSTVFDDEVGRRSAEIAVNRQSLTVRDSDWRSKCVATSRNCSVVSKHSTTVNMPVIARWNGCWSGII